jgi:hypothetical protein
VLPQPFVVPQPFAHQVGGVLEGSGPGNQWGASLQFAPKPSMFEAPVHIIASGGLQVGASQA